MSRTHGISRSTLSCAVLAIASAVSAQRPIDSVALPRGANWPYLTVYDAARERVVVHTGDDQPSDWTGAELELRIGTRTAAFSTFLGWGATRAVFDSARESTFAVDAFGDWYHDGRDWTATGTSARPPGRFAHAIAYDVARDRVVLFGGNVFGAPPIGARADTWEWDGHAWQQLAPATSPPPLQEHAMAYDIARGRTVLFGGRDAAFNACLDTWEWDGSAWVDRAPAHHPGSSLVGMAYDDVRSRIVLAAADGVWEWDGVDWTRVANTAMPTYIAFDGTRGELVGFDGMGAVVWDGRAVTRRPTVARRTGDAYATRIVTDAVRGSALTFGGIAGSSPCGDRPGDATFVWDGSRWTQRVPAVAPSPRAGFGLVEDVARGRIVLFGGFLGGTCTTPAPVYGDLWEWDGQSWQPGSNQNAPAPRAGFAFAWDATRGRAVLFGGSDNFAAFDDTWEWDGTAWLQRLATTHPSALLGATMAFDAPRSRCVLFGATGYSVPSSETWEWDGNAWIQTQPATTPPPDASGHSLFFDPLRGHVVLAHSGGVWEWDGADWATIPLARPLPPGPITFDPASGGWITPTHRIGDVVPADVTDVGAGCAGSAGTPILAATAPLLGNPAFRVEVLGTRPSAPTAIVFGVGAQPVSVGGCTIYPAPPWLPCLLATNAYGAGWVSLPLPLAPALRGVTLHAQAAVLDPSTPRGFSTTGAQRVQIGEGYR